MILSDQEEGTMQEGRINFTEEGEERRRGRGRGEEEEKGRKRRSVGDLAESGSIFLLDALVLLIIQNRLHTSPPATPL